MPTACSTWPCSAPTARSPSCPATATAPSARRSSRPSAAAPVDALVAGYFTDPHQLSVAEWLSSDGTLIVLPASPSGAWGQETVYNMAPGTILSGAPLVAADLNGDGKDDLVLGNNSSHQL